jgi:hypothetical protein
MKNFIGIFGVLILLSANLNGQSHHRGTSVVIVDPGIPSADILLNHVTQGSKVFHLDGLKDPLASILSVLKTNAPVATLHLFCEGRPGSLVFTSLSVSKETLEENMELLGNWRNYFADGGDILLYGGEVARGEAGIDFIRNLAIFTGIDVAASDNQTGSWRKGGDWLLEIHSGRIESQIAVNNKVTEKYKDVLSGALD